MLCYEINGHLCCLTCRPCVLYHSSPSITFMGSKLNICCLCCSVFLKEYWGLFRGHLHVYLTSSDKVVFGKSMSVLSISLGYQLKRRERRKSVVLKNRCKMVRDNNHQSLYKKIKLYNDIECRESGTSIHE